MRLGSWVTCSRISAGESSLPRIALVPWDKVWSLSPVRSARMRTCPKIKLRQKMTKNASAMPAPAKSQSWSLWCFISLSSSDTADDNARGEQGEDHQRGKKQDVAQVNQTPLETVEMRHHAEAGDGIHQPLWGPSHQQVGHRLPAAHDQNNAHPHRYDGADYLMAGDRGCCASHR